MWNTGNAAYINYSSFYITDNEHHILSVYSAIGPVLDTMTGGWSFKITIMFEMLMIRR